MLFFFFFLWLLWGSCSCIFLSYPTGKKKKKKYVVKFDLSVEVLIPLTGFSPMIPKHTIEKALDLIIYILGVVLLCKPFLDVQL